MERNNRSVDSYTLKRVTKLYEKKNMRTNRMDIKLVKKITKKKEFQE